MWNFDKLIWEFIVIIYYPQEPNKQIQTKQIILLFNNKTVRLFKYYFLKQLKVKKKTPLLNNEKKKWLEIKKIKGIKNSWIKSYFETKSAKNNRIFLLLRTKFKLLFNPQNLNWIFFLLHQTQIGTLNDFFFVGRMIDFFSIILCVAQKNTGTTFICVARHMLLTMFWKMFSSILRELCVFCERELLNFIQYIHSKHIQNINILLMFFFPVVQPVANLTSSRHDIHIAFLAFLKFVLNFKPKTTTTTNII